MSLSRRYARALLDLAQKTNSVELVATRLDELDASFRENPELREILRNPMFAQSKRKSILEEVARAVQAPEHLIVFLGFIFDKDRLNILPELARVFRRLADEQAGVIRGEVVSATQLDTQQVESINGALRNATGRQVALSVKQDSSLLGGAVARVGDVVFDGSVRTQLQQMKTSLLEG